MRLGQGRPLLLGSKGFLAPIATRRGISHRPSSEESSSVADAAGVRGRSPWALVPPTMIGTRNAVLRVSPISKHSLIFSPISSGGWGAVRGQKVLRPYRVPRVSYARTRHVHKRAFWFRFTTRIVLAIRSPCRSFWSCRSCRASAQDYFTV
jgi:hypothetical protein